MIISVSGLINSGKDTVAAHLVEKYGFTKLSFAGHLKDALSCIFGWDRVLLDGTTAESRKWRDQVDPWWSERLNIPNLTPRWMMQNFGTNLCRNHFHDEIWIASLENKIRQLNTHIVVTDARFQNEIAAMNSAGAVLIRVKRGPDPEWFEMAKTVEGRKTLLLRPDIHPSEYDWASSPFDMVINNESTLSALHQEVDKMMSLFVAPR